MRLSLLFILLFTSLLTFAQVDSSELKKAMVELDRALVEKNEKVLDRLLHKEVSFGHSNGWVQSRSEVFDDFRTGKLVYLAIEKINGRVVTINKKMATARLNINVEGAVSGKSFKMSLHVLQVWLKNKKGWVLLARQSTKT